MSSRGGSPVATTRGAAALACSHSVSVSVAFRPTSARLSEARPATALGPMTNRLTPASLNEAAARKAITAVAAE